MIDDLFSKHKYEMPESMKKALEIAALSNEICNIFEEVNEELKQPILYAILHMFYDTCGECIKDPVLRFCEEKGFIKPI